MTKVCSLFLLLSLGACGGSGGGGGPENSARTATIAAIDVPEGVTQYSDLTPVGAKASLGFAYEALLFMLDLPSDLILDDIQVAIDQTADFVEQQSCSLSGSVTVSSFDGLRAYTTIFNQCRDREGVIDGEISVFMDKADSDGIYFATVSFKGLTSADDETSSTFDGSIRYQLNLNNTNRWDLSSTRYYSAVANIRISDSIAGVNYLDDVRYSRSAPEDSSERFDEFSIVDIDCVTGVLYREGFGRLDIGCNQSSQAIILNSDSGVSSSIRSYADYTDFFFHDGGQEVSIRLDNQDLFDQVYNFELGSDNAPQIREERLNTWQQERVFDLVYPTREAVSTEFLIELDGVFYDADGDFLDIQLSLDNVYTLESYGNNPDVLR